jgi:hypothetical protein
MLKIRECQDAVQHRHPLLEDVWYTIDGIKLMLECSSDDNKQNRFCNGWTCDHYIGGVLVSCPDGTIPICCYNVPDTVHDSNIASIGKIYNKFEDVYSKTGGRCTADSAFSCNNLPFLIKSCKPSLKMTIEEIEVAKEAASMRQSSEWGMRGFRPSSFKFKIEFLWNTKDSENE